MFAVLRSFLFTFGSACQPQVLAEFYRSCACHLPVDPLWCIEARSGALEMTGCAVTVPSASATVSQMGGGRELVGRELSHVHAVDGCSTACQYLCTRGEICCST